MTKITEQKNGCYTYFERLFPSGYWMVTLYNAAGQMTDRVRTDDYKNARAYWKTFNLIAKNGA